MTTRDPELKRFKAINLTQYTASLGYQIDAKSKHRSRHSVRMVDADGHKINIFRGTDGNWLYWNPFNEADTGSIIDFVKNRERCSLGRARQILRDWGGHAAAIEPHRYVRDLEPSTPDHQQVLKLTSQSQPVDKHRYLTQERGISEAVLASKRFSGTVWQKYPEIDQFGEALFPHRNQRDEITGFEIKNRGFTSFSKGGVKGLWRSRCLAADQCVVFAETAIDALSYGLLNPDQDDRTRYFSTGGSLNPEQFALIGKAISKMPADSQVIIATDADDPGRHLAGQIENLAAETHRDDITTTRSEPPVGGQDWNDQVKAKFNIQPPGPLKKYKIARQPKKKRKKSA